MMNNLVGVLVFLSVFGIISSDSRRKIDCRMYIYAPMCRGMQMKRDTGRNFDQEPPVRFNGFGGKGKPGRIPEYLSGLRSINNFKGRGGHRNKIPNLFVYRNN